MPEHTSILNILLESIFIGFGIVVAIVALLKTSNLTKLKFKELFILTAVQAVRVGGILYFLLWVVYTLTDEVLKVRMVGPYWWAYLYNPIMILLLTQLLWIKKLYVKSSALITLAILLLILPSLGYVYHRFLTWGTEMDMWQYLTPILLQFVLNIIVFIFITFTIMLAGNKFKKIKE